ncbi:RNA polymerase sigma-70 factor (ECF subfamily) [Prosthecobacter fusiformis]|uniref:RNA polymerase sigma-70 factor (ECF subfamily) n=1 Tax=Prosthecobacter fusiformis TaxID=48464 RepID=A0A4R7RM56_9BACT|nr:sigma-70 family RNA polymerase sigma factor [Prosthecobacter fusiformis]TDU66029.1 RNA polymerase sigma-70 factor (ECF subfamily) [Prosthecobacter fusiformis]
MPPSAPDSETRFRDWLERYRPLLFKVVRGFTNSRQDEEELFQDVLVQLWHSAARFSGGCADSTWVYRVAFNTAMAWSRAAKTRRVRHTETVDFDSIPAPVTPDETQIDELYAAIRQLPPSETALIMMHLEGASYREMAAVMGLSEVNIGTKLTRARMRLAELMKGTSHD